MHIATPVDEQRRIDAARALQAIRQRIIRLGPAATCTVAVWFPMLLWFLAFRPGLMSSDSLSAYAQVHSGDWYDGTNPPLYVLAMWVAVHTLGPSLLTVGQSLFLAAAITSLARSVLRAGAPRRLVIAAVIVVAVSPAVGAFSVTLWKDIPYTAVLLLMAARIVDLAAARATGSTASNTWTWVALGGWSLAAALLRQNAPLVVAIAGIWVIIAFRHWWRSALVTFTVVGAMFFAVRAMYPAVGIRPVDKGFAASAFVRDIGGVYRDHPEAFDTDDLRLMSSLLPLPLWSERYFCLSVNTFYNVQPGIDFGDQAKVTGDLIDLWMRLARSHPTSIISTRMCAGSIAWRPWSSADQDVYTVPADVDRNAFGLRTDPIVDALHRPLSHLAATIDRASWETVFWRAPGYLYALYIALAFGAWRRRSLGFVVAAAVPIAQQVTVWAFSVAPDARYMFVGQLLALLLLPLAWAPNLRRAPATSAAGIDSGLPESALDAGSGEADAAPSLQVSAEADR